MKKIVAMLLVLAVALALVACAGDDGGNNTNPTPTPPPTTPAPTPGTAADGNTPPDLPPVGEHVPEGDNTIGFVTDNVDHWDRPSYHIVYYNFEITALTAQITDAYTRLGEVYNFTVEQLTANGDPDLYITNLHTILLRGPDGVVVDMRQELAPRVAQVLSEYDVPAVCLFNKTTDANDVNLIPTVIMDQFYNGGRQLEFLDSIYTQYWGNIDKSEIRLLILDWSTNMDINMRAQGAEAKWKELYGNQEFIYGDTAPIGLSSEAGYDVVNSILAANPDVQYWFIVGTLEDIVLGGSRAVEALGKEDTVLMTGSGASILPGEWDAGYDGVWIANYAIPPFLYAGTGLFGLLAMIDGRADTGTLWPDYFLSQDKAARFMLGADMMTRANYVEYIANILRSFGVEP